MGNHGLQGWIDSGNCPYEDDISSSPEVCEMRHNEAEVARNYTVHLAHFFSHLGNYRMPVDPSLCKVVIITHFLLRFVWTNFNDYPFKVILLVAPETYFTGPRNLHLSSVSGQAFRY